MQAIQLAELGLTLVKRAGQLSSLDDVPAHSLLAAHLDASRERLEAWSARFRQIASCSVWRLSPSLVHEVFVSEILVRASAGIARIGMPAVSPIFEHLVSSHSVVRRQIEQLLKSRRLWLKQFQTVAQRSSRWSDILLGHLSSWVDVSTLGFSQQRVLDYAENGPLDALQASLLQDSLRTTLQGGGHQPTGNEGLNQQIASSVVSCLPARLVRRDPDLTKHWRPSIEMAMVTADAAPLVEQHSLRN